jgi:hypothetical protein
VAVVMILVGASVAIKLRLDQRRAREAAGHDKERLAAQTKTIAEGLKNCHIVHAKLTGTVEADRQAILTVLT